MKRTLIIAALGMSVLSYAQNFDQPTNIAVRLGYAYPIDPTTRDLVRGFIGVGVDYFPQLTLLKNAETSISFDWLGKSGSGAKGNVFPILLNQRFYNNSETGEKKSWFFFGAGVAVVDIVSTKTVWAARVGYGFMLGENLFGEIPFLYTDSAGSARATSLGFYLGYRF